MAEKRKASEVTTMQQKWLWLLTVGAIFIIIFFALATTVFAMRSKYHNRIWPGVSVAGVDVSGLTAEEALTAIRQHINAQYTDGISYSSAEKTISIRPITVAADDPDISTELVNWNVTGAVEQALSYGNGSLLSSIGDLRLLIAEKNQTLAIDWNRDEFKNILLANFEGLLSTKAEAQLFFDGTTPRISSESSGINYNFDQALDETAVRLSTLSRQQIQLEKKIEQPQLTRANLQPLLPDVTTALNFDAFSLTHETQEYIITPDILRRWLHFTMTDSGPRLTVAGDAFSTWLTEKVRPDVEQEMRNAKFQLDENGRVSEFEGSQDGIKINDELLAAAIDASLETPADVSIPTTIVPAQYTVGDVNDLGISELLGTGVSDFSGSPVNRRHNIKVGADTLNGLLISPDEEFSLLDALGEIDATSGYLQELVIKGDKTIPEYGGGLCQIGTTTFRATLASGLPIVERRNHSYRVAYYEPAGTDATIYDPWPDYKFKNDTGNYVLIETEIDGDTLRFHFWGTRDGRTVEKTEPTIYNIVPPPPTKYIETLDLEPGKIKCTERAHNGADAYFDYTVQYPDGHIAEERFRSHYVPWQEVCLIGVEELTQPEDSTNTPAETAANSLN